jgi:uncharacterized surface protein with fasciclin (FAS1) repeats
MVSNSQYILRFAILAVFLTAFEVAHAQNVMEQLQRHSQTSQFARALADANLQDRLNGAGPFTLFAPTNATFNRLNSGQKTDRQLLLNHIFTGMATQRSLTAMSEVTCLSGQTLTISADGAQLLIDEVAVIESNIRAENGIIHVVDGVLK